jgi:hypothetical protein
MPQLRVFSYAPVEGLDAFYQKLPPADLEQQLVQVLPQLQNLQQLQLVCLTHWPSPSSASTNRPSCCVLFLMMFGVARGFADWYLGALLRIL